MRYPLKAITPGGVAGALAKAERYRLLNDPEGAESICLDVLDAEPDNRQALVTLLLARSDQIEYALGAGVAKAREVLVKLHDPYERAYYGGLICERRAQAALRSTTMGAAALAHEWFIEAMECYEEAEKIRPAGNDDALLRWNACARALNANPHLAPRHEPSYEPTLGE
ncbi:MAG: hypothetical protein AB7R55_10050 [Gemmatimonadales bacterium]